MDTNRSIRRHIVFGLGATIFLFGGAVAWSLTAQLTGAVVTQGVFVVDGNVKAVQHPTGGVVAELRVREGQRVAEGDLLLRLDDTQARASLGLVTSELTALRVRQARLAAERDGLADFTLSAELAERAERDRDFAAVVAGERGIIAARKASREGQRAQLTERIGQLREEISALEAQNRANNDQLGVADSEMRDLQGLFQRGLIQRPRITQLEREIIRTRGTIAEIAARIAQTRGRISETEIQILQLERDALSDVTRELRETETRIAGLDERRIAAEDVLTRVEIRAPASGAVLQLQAHTVGGVINPANPVMLIVPEGGGLIIEARVSPTDIEQVATGQETRIRLSALNARTTPEVTGEVSRVAADVTREQQTGATYYVVGIRLRDGEIERIAPQRLVPGMPAEAFIRTDDRTMAEYLARPLTDQIRRAMRER
jgi:HlyD family secretion protein